jgi:hypothetical protein
MATWRVLQHWINSLPPESCALVSSPEDLTDGRVFSDIIATIEGRVIPKFKSAVSGLPRLRLVICHLVRGALHDYLSTLASRIMLLSLLNRARRMATVGCRTNFQAGMQLTCYTKGMWTLVWDFCNS